MAVALIPARGGSKRIPRKNVRPFHGKPMIAWTIQALQDSGVVDRIIVSTDDAEIAQIALQYGAEAPFMRPAELSGDHVDTEPVVAHALRFLQQRGELPAQICCAYATAPFMRAEYVREGLRLLVERQVSSVFSVTTFSFPIFRALRLDEAGSLKMFWPEHEATRSQDLPVAYHDAGQFYWLDSTKFLDNARLYGDDALPVVLPRHLVQDIDDLEDWRRAELMFDALLREAEGHGADPSQS